MACSHTFGDRPFLGARGPENVLVRQKIAGAKARFLFDAVFGTTQSRALTQSRRSDWQSGPMPERTGDSSFRGATADALPKRCRRFPSTTLRAGFRLTTPRLRKRLSPRSLRMTALWSIMYSMT